MISRVTLISLSFVIIVIFDTFKSANCDRKSLEDDTALREFEEFLSWRKISDDDNYNRDSANGIDRKGGMFFMNENNDRVEKIRRTSAPLIDKFSAGTVDPPPVDQPALMGRYIVNQADWTSVATISSRKDIFSFPIANVISVSDGPLGNGTGVPYMYLTPLDFTAQDLEHDDRATLLMTLAQGSYCKGKKMDPMDPRCARIILAGRIEKIMDSSDDYETAKKSVFGRHPWLADMPADHHFFFAKLNIESIAVLDTFGGPKYVSVADYMNPPTSFPPKIHQRHHRKEPKFWPRDDFKKHDSEERKYVLRI